MPFIIFVQSSIVMSVQRAVNVTFYAPLCCIDLKTTVISTQNMWMKKRT